jgi:NADPH:quinone reductase-like Zn-dependent oxidoreductase
VLRKPPSLSFDEAACLPTAWLTAYRMLFVHSGLRPGQAMYVTGRLGSIAAALVRLGDAAGIRVWTQAATAADRDHAYALGAERVLTPEEATDDRVDAVFDAGVDEAAWSHATRWLRPGGVLVCAGYRSGATRTGYDLANLHRIIFSELRVVGSAMGTAADLADLLAFLGKTGLRPEIATVLPMVDAAAGLRSMLAGEVKGKIVLTR